MKIEIVGRSPVRVWSVRLRGAMVPENLRETYSRLWQWQISQGIAGRNQGAMGIFYGDYKGGDEAFRYYAGIVWDEPVRPAEEIEIHEVAGGKYACYRLVGSYHGIPSAFQRLYGDWLPKSGFIPDDRPALEIYRNNPMDTPENELITDLLIPVR